MKSLCEKRFIFSMHAQGKKNPSFPPIPVFKCTFVTFAAANVCSTAPQGSPEHKTSHLICTYLTASETHLSTPATSRLPGIKQFCTKAVFVFSYVTTPHEVFWCYFVKSLFSYAWATFVCGCKEAFPPPLALETDLRKAIVAFWNTAEVYKTTIFFYVL